ncbi:hypothetical protein ACHJH3_06235 [Campylobacter sp. MOP7]|uniref:hypothetical protein n=1 Tax=Campylobacter canis TaxID=3378588 RepID=UPI00387E9F81
MSTQPQQNITVLTHRSRIKRLFDEVASDNEFVFGNVKCLSNEQLFFKQIDKHAMDILLMRVSRMPNTLILNGKGMRKILQSIDRKKPEILCIDSFKKEASGMFTAPFLIDDNLIECLHGQQKFYLDTSIFNSFFLYQPTVNSSCMLIIQEDLNVCLLKRTHFCAVCGIRI